MNKEEILEKSRMENKDKDIVEKETLKEAGNAGAIAALILCAIFFTVQIFVGGGCNWGLWAIVLVIEAAGFTVKAIRLRKKHEIFVAIGYGAVTLMLSVGYIWQLISSSQIL